MEEFLFMSKITGGGVLTIWAVLQIPWSQAERKSWLHQTRVFLSKHVFTSAVANLWCIKQRKQFPSVYLLLVTSAHCETTHRHTPKPCWGVVTPHFDSSLLNWLMLHDGVQAETAPPKASDAHLSKRLIVLQCMPGKEEKSLAHAEMLNAGFAAWFQHQHSVSNKIKCREISELTSSWQKPGSSPCTILC